MSCTLKIVSFNLRCAYTEDGVNSFIHRAGMIFDKINTEKPDIICAQEAVPTHVSLLKRSLPGYTVIYNGRGKCFDGEGLALIIRNDTLNLIGLDFFWLSETPYVPASRYPDQSMCPRICQVGMLQIAATNKPFYVYNNHLDHGKKYARIHGIKQVLDRVVDDNKKFDLPVFILGDFNADPDSETIRYCNEFKDFPLVDITKTVEGPTYHGFGNCDQYTKIDYIYTDPGTAAKVIEVKKWDDELNGIFMSDHYPICATVNMED